MFIVIEALDGVGKGTIIAGLKARGWTTMATPGDELRPFFSALLAMGASQEARAYAYAESVVVQSLRARAASEAGHKVVMDRGILSTLAYARARGVAGLEPLLEVIPLPDRTILLTLDEEMRRRRLNARGSPTEADLETLNVSFRTTVQDEMLRPGRCPALTPEVVRLNGGSPEEELHQVLAACGE